MIGSKEIEALFQNQLDQIQDGDLRKKVIHTFVLACERGGWKSTKELLDIPFTLLTETHGINFVEHTIAVTEGAVGLAKSVMNHYKHVPYRINFDLLYAGGLLHDVGKLVEIKRNNTGGYQKSLSGKYARHTISGVLLAAERDIPEQIINIIACHSKEGEGRPQVIETILVHQADFAVFNPLVMKEKGLLIENE